MGSSIRKKLICVQDKICMMRYILNELARLPHTVSSLISVPIDSAIDCDQEYIGTICTQSYNSLLFY